MKIARRFTALISSTFAALAQPPPVKVTLGPKVSGAFRDLEDRARAYGLPISADQIATALAGFMDELSSTSEPCDMCHVLTRLDMMEQAVDMMAELNRKKFDSLAMKFESLQRAFREHSHGGQIPAEAPGPA